MNTPHQSQASPSILLDDEDLNRIERGASTDILPFLYTGAALFGGLLCYFG